MGRADDVELVERLADAEGFSGVVSVRRGEQLVYERGFGARDRAHDLPNTPQTRFAIASGTKSFTAVTIASLIDEGALSWTTPAREVLGADLPLIDHDVTVEHLLQHRSGIGDYVDEEDEELDAEDYVLTVPVHRLHDVAAYLEVLDGLPSKFVAGSRVAYSNSGYVVLALLAERVAGRPFYDLVADRVLQPAGMTDTGFLRLDALPGDAAVGYLADGRSHVLHLPVRGSGDGGAYSTALDIARFWTALFDGRLLPGDVVDRLTQPALSQPDEGLLAASGFWREADRDNVVMNGGDAGISFDSECDVGTGTIRTVLSNTTYGAVPIARLLSTCFR